MLYCDPRENKTVIDGNDKIMVSTPMVFINIKYIFKFSRQGGCF